MSTVVVVSDWTEVDHELDRLIAMPTPEATAGLNAVLATGFAASNEATHVRTGSLKSSEKVEETVQPGQWEGDTRWGGPSGGVNNPVDYAIYEQRRGGSHDFTAPLESTEPLYVEAVAKALLG